MWPAHVLLHIPVFNPFVDVVLHTTMVSKLATIAVVHDYKDEAIELQLFQIYYSMWLLGAFCV